MRELLWSDATLRDFDEAIFHVARESERAAIQIADRIEAAAALLADMPIGRAGRVTGTFEKLVVRTSYILVYALADDAVTILHVIHGHREWLDDTWPTDR